MSDVDMNTPELTFNQNGKTSRIPLYHGDRKDLDDWLLHCDLHFHKYETSNDDKPMKAVECLRDEAFTWVKPFLRRYMDDDDESAEITLMFEDWTEFKRVIKQAFGLHKETVTAEYMIQNLRQLGSAADYANKFRQYSTQVEWNDDALRHMYKRSLKAEVRMELMRTSATTDTLDRMIDESIRIDNELYQYKLENRAYGRERQGRVPNQGKPRNNFVRHTQTTRATGYYTSKDPEPMHIDAIERKEKKHWKVTTQKNSKGKTGVECYACGKKGHFARECRSKNKVTRQLNVIGRGGYSNPSDDSDDTSSSWEIIAPIEEGYGEMELHTEAPEPYTTLKQDANPAYGNFHMHPGVLVESTANSVPREYLQVYDSGIPQRVMEDHSFGTRRNCINCRDRHVKCTWTQGQLHCNTCSKRNDQCKGPASQTAKYNEYITSLIEYDVDWRNPNHAKRHHRYCYYDYCDVHYHEKWANSCFPTNKHKCKWEFFDCKNDHCADHLWDKRTIDYFPGQSDDRAVRRNLMVNNKCFNETWHTCMNPDCKRHAKEKRHHGFDEQSFLERNRQLGLGKENIPPVPELDSDHGSDTYATSDQILLR